MGCSHCMIAGSGPDGKHMERRVFRKALYLTADLGDKTVLISGGEPLMHPEITDMVASVFVTARLIGTVIQPLVASNGLFLEDPDLFKEAVSWGIPIQVTRDPRFYPIPLSEAALHRAQHPMISLETQIRLVTPCDRVKAAGIKSTRQSPMCFNLRSATRKMGLLQAISLLRAHGKFCTPSVNVDGTVVAGEADTCARIGTVQESSILDIERNLKVLRCGKCGLYGNLEDYQRAAIEDIPG